ncbi:MAG: tRNA (adenosine(37)-N6)-threonylcarbamoyltransferase complex transferase subunit TsaD [Spirochaetia bacterium]|jgi:N6-L-threonylcarbamoyladenine synthase|nr:tRNA (adenosine(37)-N6)-threonylcarbamoyltransferase complex transferase subunit TsaD [Spirochaetia bacterium]
MKILGIETSCDECAASVVEDGNIILSNIVATQIDNHKLYNGVVPEIASRLHLEWIISVVKEATEDSGIDLASIDGIAVTNRPGLVGSLLVGLSFAKGLALSLNKPYIGVDHIMSHLYAPYLENHIEYPYLGVLVSGGHTIISHVTEFNKMEVLGTTIDDACGEAFDKVAKFYELGYPGGIAIDRLSSKGDSGAFNFPNPSLHKGDHRYDVSYSGLKTAVINQLDQFRNGDSEKSKANIAASFQRAAVNILIRRVKKALKDTGLTRLVAGGGVVANSLLRKELLSLDNIETIIPSMSLCTDNAAMIAGIGYHHLVKGLKSDYTLNASSRVPAFRKKYP